MNLKSLIVVLALGIGAILCGSPAHAAPPTLLANCGVGASVDSNSSKYTGTVTLGTGVVSACTITFDVAYTTYNHCSVTPRSLPHGVFSVGLSLTVITLNFNPAAPVSSVYNYLCDGDGSGVPLSSANPSATIGLTAVNGSAGTYMTSDSAPALSQGIIPTWTGFHTFSAGLASSGAASSINKSSNFATEINDGTSTGNVTIGNNLDLVTIGAPLTLGNGSAVSAASWTTNGIGLSGNATTFTDSTGSGTIPVEAAYAFPVASIAASTASTTISNLAELYLPAPLAGTNVTATNLWSLEAAGGIKGSGAVQLGGGVVTIGQNNNFTIGIGTGTDTQTVTVGGGSNAVTINATTLTLGGSTLVTSTSPATFSNAAIRLTGLASSSAATTGTVCWTTGAANLTVDTTVACLASTRKVKENIEPLDIGLDAVLSMQPVSYNLKTEFNPEHLGPQVGLVAEDVAQIDSRLVAVDDNGDPRGVRYMQLTAVLVKAIQQQQLEIYVLALWCLLMTGGLGYVLLRRR